MKRSFRSAAIGALAVVQTIAALRVWSRLIRTRDGIRIDPVSAHAPVTETATVILPVLNEEARISPCLEGLIAHGCEVSEILVVDGGSTDRTREIVAFYADQDHRVKLLEAPPEDDGRNGKALQLEHGLRRANWNSDWVLTIDADVRPSACLARSMIAHANRAGISALSVATVQHVSGRLDALLHPSMLATLVYRFGIPGRATQRPGEIQANGQCFLVRMDLLELAGGFENVADSVCEDVTLARGLASTGVPVGFYEAGDLVRVTMYQSWQQTWQNWPRSLPLRDRYARWSSLAALLEMSLTQALPLALVPLGIALDGRSSYLARLNSALLLTRIGVLAGTHRAYESTPWTYWLSPLADLPVTLRLWQSAFQRTHSWRGRSIKRGVST
ncbi:glycosyltransferase family 2 protein [soil metagenome]